MNGDGLREAAGAALLPGVPSTVPTAVPRLVGPAARGQQLRINFLANQDRILATAGKAESGALAGTHFNQWLEPQVAGGKKIATQRPPQGGLS